MEDPEISHAKGEFPVGAGPVVKDETMTWAVHRLQAKGLLLNIKPVTSRQPCSLPTRPDFYTGMPHIVPTSSLQPCKSQLPKPVFVVYSVCYSTRASSVVLTLSIADSDQLDPDQHTSQFRSRN